MAFKVTEEHASLMERLCWYWEGAETGAPAVDPKRPYGNSGVARDIAEILDDEPDECPHCGEALVDTDRLMKLHRQMLPIMMALCERAREFIGMEVKD